jgi:hypothetical protein
MSETCGWRWPTGAVQGLVVVSFPGSEGRKGCAEAAPIADTIATTTSIFEVIIGVSKCIPPCMCGSDIWICSEGLLFPLVA